MRDKFKKDRGFAGQKMIVLPQKIIDQIKKNPLLNRLFVTHIGFFPNADSHYRERKEGINQYILIYCIDGKGWFEISNQKFEVEPVSFFILPAGIPHSYGANTNNPWSIYWVHFSGRSANNFIDVLGDGNNLIYKKITQIEERINIFNDIYLALARGYRNSNLGIANTSFWHFIGTFCYSNTYKQLKTVNLKDPIESSIIFMKENLDQNFTLEDLAKNAHYSVSHYSSLFNEKTGYSPIDYFINLKIQRACQYLDLTTLNISEIAKNIGYNDPYYFSRLFRKLMGYSPTEYRKKQNG